MSAFLVNKKHIDALLSWAMKQDHLYYWWENQAQYINFSTANKVGKILVDANVLSVNTRYREQIKPSNYHFEYYLKPLSPVEIIQACDCLDYQSCEFEGWKDSEACCIVDRIRSHAWHNLPGYDEAKCWDISS